MLCVLASSRRNCHLRVLGLRPVAKSPCEFHVMARYGPAYGPPEKSALRSAPCCKLTLRWLCTYSLSLCRLARKRLQNLLCLGPWCRCEVPVGRMAVGSLGESSLPLSTCASRRDFSSRISMCSSLLISSFLSPVHGAPLSLRKPHSSFRLYERRCDLAGPSSL